MRRNHESAQSQKRSNDSEKRGCARARAATTLCVPQWAEYDLRGSLETLESGIAHARAGELADPLNKPK